MLTPESAVEIQERLGSDMMMALDECTPYPADAARGPQASLELTARWAERCSARAPAPTQALFGIVQGGVYPDLRRLSAAQITAMAFDGYRGRRARGGRAEGRDAARWRR